MNAVVQSLICALVAIEQCEEITPTDYLTNGDPEELHPLIQNADLEACGALIQGDGRVNGANMLLLRNAGYDVFPGEQDSFGWLSGCIRTSKGIVVYG